MAVTQRQTYNTPTSPLMLADRLLTIAEESDRAGFTKIAECLLGLAHDVLEKPARPH